MQTIEQRLVFQPRHPPAAFLISFIEPRESLVAVAEVGGDHGEVIRWEVVADGVLSERVVYQPGLFRRASARVDYGQYHGSDGLQVINAGAPRHKGFKKSRGF